MVAHRLRKRPETLEIYCLLCDSRYDTADVGFKLIQIIKIISARVGRFRLAAVKVPSCRRFKKGALHQIHALHFLPQEGRPSVPLPMEASAGPTVGAGRDFESVKHVRTEKTNCHVNSPSALNTIENLPPTNLVTNLVEISGD